MTVHGFIGLGMMGSAMAERLVEVGAELVVHDVDPAAVERLVALGAAAAGSAAEVAERADVVGVCVPAAEHLEAVLAGPGGLSERAREGQPVVVHSTVHPETVHRCASLASEWGGLVFDACVAGGAAAARTGELAIFAGGLGDAPAAVRELLELHGTKVIDAGPVGAGAALKLAVNVMTYAQFAAASTAHDLVVGAGADPSVLLDAWRHTGMLGALTEQFAGLLGLSADQVDGELRAMLETQVGIARKDLRLARELGGPGRGADFVAAIEAMMPEAYRTASQEDDR